ncbi:hypothetical protein CPB83DRAFT_936946, partial [Crepidotus variabilis]
MHSLNYPDTNEEESNFELTIQYSSSRPFSRIRLPTFVTRSAIPSQEAQTLFNYETEVTTNPQRDRESKDLNLVSGGDRYQSSQSSCVSSLLISASGPRRSLRLLEASSPATSTSTAFYYCDFGTATLLSHQGPTLISSIQPTPTENLVSCVSTPPSYIPSQMELWT